MTGEKKEFPLKERYDLLIDAGNLEKIYEENKCRTPGHDTRKKSCGMCPFLDIQVRKSSSFAITMDLVEPHCVIADYVVNRLEFYKIPGSLKK